MDLQTSGMAHWLAYLHLDGVLECAFDSWAGTNSDGTFDGTPAGGEDALFGNGAFVGMDPSGLCGYGSIWGLSCTGGQSLGHG